MSSWIVVGVRLAVVLALLAPAKSAQADDTHHQSYLLGQRAIGMGGAFTALGEDASAAFYNPAGASWIQDSSASVNLSIYGLDRLRVEDGYTAVLDSQRVAVDLESQSFVTLPNTSGIVKPFGPKLGGGHRRFAGGFSVFVRDDIKRSVSEVLEGPMSRGTFKQTELDRTVWFAPSISYRLRRDLSVGLATVLATRSVKRERNAAFESEESGCVPPGCASTEIVLDEELVEYSSRELFARLGVRYDPMARLHLGLTLSTPTAHVAGSGRIIGTHSLTVIDPVTGQGSATYDPRENAELEVRNPRALELRAGVAYGRNGASMAALDVSFHAAHSYDPITLRDPNDPDTALVSFHVPTVERRAVVNVNLGGEYYLGRFPLRGGVFTNLSSAPTVVTSASNQLPDLDVYGVSAGVGYQSSGGFELTLGALLSVGSGQVAAWDPQADSGLGSYVPASARQTAVFVYLAGAKKYAKRVAKKLGKKPGAGKSK